MKTLVITPKKKRHPALKALRLRGKEQTTRTVVLSNQDIAIYSEALGSIGVSSHAFLRSCVGALVADYQEQQKAAKQ